MTTRFLHSLLILLALASFVYAQTPLEKDELGKIEKQPAAAPRAQPKGSRAAQTPRNGVLFVLTAPAEAQVRVQQFFKNRAGKVVASKKSDKEGEFRQELPAGTYRVEVSLASYSPFLPKEVQIKPQQSLVVKAGLAPTTGVIIIGGVEPNATILLDGKTPPNINPKKEENQIELKDIDSGSYKLRITQSKFIDWERDEVPVQGGAISFITPRFERAIANVLVKSEPGADISIDDTSSGKLDGSGKRAFGIEPGKHRIKAEKLGYDSKEETGAFVIGKNEVFELKLTPIVFKPFQDNFINLKSWFAPPAWQLSHNEGKKGMTVLGPGLGLVKDTANDKILAYKDFVMTFDISLLNNKGAVWVVRAQDDKNYYMFQLTGPKGSPRKTFSSYICRGGQIKDFSAPMVVPVNMSDNASITIVIEAIGPTITHSIAISSDPRTGLQPLNIVKDPDFFFPIGGVGFSTKNGEEFIIRFVSIESK